MTKRIQPNLKTFRSYVLAAFPFIAFFGYQVAVVLPHRPEHADMAHGYTFGLELGDDRTHYISTMDGILTFGPFVCALVIIGIGMWRCGAFARKKFPNYNSHQ